MKYPAPVQLEGKNLPWVQHFMHLGHTLHQTVSMDKDCHRARAKFIDSSVEVRNQFSFAQPQQVLKMVQVLSCDAYGSMLWDLQSEPAEQLFKCWNTCVKLVYRVPRSTHTYMVEGFLASSQVSLRNQILSRYPAFYRKLLVSPSREVRMLSKMVSADSRSPTCRNLKYIRSIMKHEQAEWYSPWRVRDMLPVKSVPENEKWRLGLLTHLMELRQNKYLEVQDSKQICAMVDSLCST